MCNLFTATCIQFDAESNHVTIFLQHIDEIPDNLKKLYKTVWEIPQRTLIDMAADRGAYIDQSQSFNVHIAEPTFPKLTSMHFYAWNKVGEPGAERKRKYCMLYWRSSTKLWRLVLVREKAHEHNITVHKLLAKNINTLYSEFLKRRHKHLIQYNILYSFPPSLWTGSKDRDVLPPHTASCQCHSVHH